MMLAIDIGNSRIKAGLLEAGELVFAGAYLKDDFPQGFLRDAGKIFSPSKLKYLGLISVGKEAEMILQSWIYTFSDPKHVLHITPETPMPFGSAYETPQTLGIDRLAAVAGALAHCGRGPVLVIDAGTAITYEYADAESVYQGGAIAPGIGLRFRALNDHTAKLPLVSIEEEFPLVGKSTRKSILSGVLNGILAEIEGTVARYRELAGPDLQVFLTGGDAEFLGNRLKNINFVDPNLLLRGIGAILTFNFHE